MAEVIDINELGKIDPALQPLAEAIQTVLDFPDEHLNANTLDSVKGMIAGALTPAQRAEAVKSMKKGFADMRYSHAKAIESTQTAKLQLNNLVTELDTTPEKKILLNSMFENIYDIFDEATGDYYAEIIDLPIKLEKGATIPSYAHETDAAADLYALENMTLSAHSTGNKVRTGISIALPEGWAALLIPRSSMGMKTGLRLSNSVGLIDQDYRGEVCALYDNISDSDYEIHAGDRIAQMLVVPAYRFKGVIVDTLPETERGEGGFGSTGK